MNIEATRAVENINFRIPEIFNTNNPEYYLLYKSNAYVEEVTFCEFLIWNSENDEREWDDDKDNYAESLEEYFIRKIEEIAKSTTQFAEIIKK